MKIHVDWLDEENFVKFRLKKLAETDFPGEFLGINQFDFPPKNTSCRFNHTKESCQCHLPAYHLGQDEAVYRQNSTSSKVGNSAV